MSRSIFQEAVAAARLAMLVAPGVLIGIGAAQAKPTAPATLCKAQPTIAACQGAVPSCALCHDGTDPPRWNPFGQGLKDELTAGQPFEQSLVHALEAIAEDDSDQDGVGNLDELKRGSAPGIQEMQTGAADAAGSNPRYKVGSYDYVFAFRRVATIYCARSPSYEELQALTQDKPDDATLKKRLHEKLSACLQSDYWQHEALPRLADKKIRPLVAAGPDSNIQIGSYRLVIGDYNYDYRMFRYVLSNDRDVRELLTARYHVVEDKSGKLSQVAGVLEKSDAKALAGGQPVPEERRAGMLTTQWFFAINTMFSSLPRTTAAQAYRAYLGADISNGEGLRPVVGEPVDVDNKGVAAPRCANCHSTLDPLSYAFAEYEGIRVNADLKFGNYLPERPKERMPAWDMTRQKSVLLDKPVKDLVEWAHVAADSDEFKRAITEMFFRQAFSRSASPEEQEAFNTLWRSLASDGYSANRLLHRLIDLPTFGRP